MQRILRLPAFCVALLFFLFANPIAQARVTWGAFECAPGATYCSQYLTWTPTGGEEDANLLWPGLSCSTAYGYRRIGLVFEGTNADASDFYEQEVFVGGAYFCTTAQALAGLTGSGSKTGKIGSVWASSRGRRVCLAANYKSLQPNLSVFKPASEYCFTLGTPPQVNCEISPPNLPLGHDVLESAAVNGNVKTSSVIAVCSFATTAVIRAIRSSADPTSTIPVRADGSINSRLTLNGSDGAAGIELSIPASPQYVTINVASTLSTSAPTPGSLQGNAVLTITGKEFPVTISGSVNAPPVTCSIGAPGPLAHNDLTVGAVQGATVSTKAALTCTGAGKTVKIQALPTATGSTAIVPLRADKSIESHLTVNGSDGYAGANVFASAAQPAEVILTSTLSSTQPTAGLLQGAAVLLAEGQQQPIGISGNVLAQTAPKALLNMELLANGSTSNLGVTWSWSTKPADYGSDTVPANDHVGLFIHNGSSRQWHALHIDSAVSKAAPWAERIQRFHDAFPSGGIRDEAAVRFGSGTWCVKLGAASTPDTGGTFLPAPGATESCVTIP